MYFDSSLLGSNASSATRHVTSGKVTGWVHASVSPCVKSEQLYLLCGAAVRTE